MSAANTGRERGGNNKGAESKCKVAAVTSSMDRHDLECITEDTTWGVVFDDIPIIRVGDLLSLKIIQIHCNFV